jgi:hypothetical protein
MSTPITASVIAGQCFRLLELSPISSFGDETPQARDAAEQYPLALGSCLSSCDWSFASTVATLPEAQPGVTDAADPNLPYLYKLPADLVKLREVLDPSVRHRIDKLGLRADMSGLLTIRYTAQVDDEASLPATFQTAVAHALALLLAPRWLSTQSKIEALERRTGQMLRKAMQEDARTGSDARYDGLDDQGDWVTEARR